MTDTMTLKLAHYSLQFSDTPTEKKHDALEVYSHDYHAIFGTEAGEEPTRRAMRVCAHDAGYTFHVMRSNWVSIRKDIIVPGTYFKGHEAFVDNAKVTGHQHDLHVTFAGCEIDRVGQVTFLASHYATKGRPDARQPRVYGANVDENRELAQGIGELAREYGKGRGLVFYGGDQNIVDRDNDTFFGEPLTSAWDELKKWENTGHGNIDVIASFNNDGRVSAKYIRALDDTEQFMNTDHFPVEAGFTVKRSRKKS